MDGIVSGVGVLDKSMVIVRALAVRPLALAELVEATGLARPTAHRLASALVEHGVVRRTDEGAFALGTELVGWGHAAAAGWPWGEAAGPALTALVEATGESAQLYVRDGDARRCLVARESPHELRTIVPEGARLPLSVGSAGRVLAGDERCLAPSVARDDERCQAPFVGWVESVEERAPGVASVSAPVRDRRGVVVAAVGVSGPVERTTREPGARYGGAVLVAAARIEDALPR